MLSKKTHIFVSLSLLIVCALSIQTTSTQQNLLTMFSTSQLMADQMLISSLPSITTMAFSQQCGNNEIQNSEHVCIKPWYIQGCETYQNTLACSKCSTGYTLNKDKKCEYLSTFTGNVTHIKGCIKQSTDVCDVCAQGFYKKDNKCALGVKNCDSYNKDGECIECSHDYSLILSQCRKNSLLGCKYETDAHTCQECYAPFTLNGQHCDVDDCRILNDYGCVSCECGFYLTADRDCKPIAPGCLRYEKGICKDCLPHYKLKGGVCQIEGCLEYTGNYCKKCSDKYDLVEGECKFKNCIDWLNDQCVTCQSGFGLKNGSCITAAPVSCQ